jgi:sensor domain CHASE-containing protein
MAVKLKDNYILNKQVRLRQDQVENLENIRIALSNQMLIDVSLSDVIRIAIDRLIKEYSEED